MLDRRAMKLSPAPAPTSGAPAPKAPPAASSVAPDELVPVPVSDKPTERLDQLVGFFQRNPGWIKTGPTADAMRAAMDHVPKVGELFRDLTEPADVGIGQAIRDQTKWQIDTGRQPDNPWWLRMNRQLVEDPLTAERAVRSGTVDQLQTGGQKAWAEYIRRSDKIYRAMGLTPEQVAAAAEAGQPVALSDAWKGTSLVNRVYTNLVLKPYARKAAWTAHRKTLEDGRPQAMKEAAEMHRRAPQEMSFSSSWATIIGYWSWLSPNLIGNQSKLAQKLILPLDTTIDEAKDLPLSKRAFVKIADWLDPTYERDIARPTDAADSAKQRDADKAA
jgi:hypothetical protein